MRARASASAFAACLLAGLAVAALSAHWPASAADSMLGGLDVTTSPDGAAVYVNGELRGTSPCRVASSPALALVPGQVFIRLKPAAYVN